MKISIEHIEERMFDYYEGNLSETEKTELLNLIHQHPEYEVDFARWAQSYAHVDHSEPDYGLTKQLLKKPVLTSYINRYTVVLSFLLLVGALTYLYTDKAEQAQDRSVQTTQSIETDDAASDKERSNTGVSIQKNKSIHSIEKKDFTSDALSPESTTTENIQTPKSISADTVSTLQTAKINETMNTVNETRKIDTISAERAVTKTNAPSQEKKKVKHKTKVSLKPSPDFIPTNPNF